LDLVGNIWNFWLHEVLLLEGGCSVMTAGLVQIRICSLDLALEPGAELRVIIVLLLLLILYIHYIFDTIEIIDHSSDN
jgi:hypothetical protein